MSRQHQLCLIGIIYSLFSFAAVSQALTPTVGEVKDSRTTGSFFAGLEVELKLVGDDLDQYKALRISLDRAVDDTGRDLLDPEKASKDFEELGSSGSQQSSMPIKLKNPARKATVVSQLNGKLEFFDPKKDPASTVKVPNIFALNGKVLESPALKQAGIVMTMINHKTYEAQKAEKKKAEIAAAKAQGASPEVLAEMSAPSEDWFAPGENAVVAELTDPNHKVVSFRVLKADGTELHRQSTMTSGNTMTIEFDQNVPDDATLELSLLTPQSTQVVALQLANIPLP